ncbi:MAG: hypothetical protein EOO36_06285, partial [Cytophagaceae bacterium]
MKNLLTATLPALALLALGGCATTGAVTSTEDDGVYYSSKDRTTVATPPAPAYQRGAYDPNGSYGSATTTTQAPADENANPDYQGGSTQSGTASGTDYYDDSYNNNSASPSGFGQPYTGPGVSTYNYTPNWSVSPSFYGSPYGYGSGLSIGYGYGGGFGGYSPFGYGYPGYAGFYDPFYSPFGYGYGSGFSIGFGYGGFGGFGYPYYSGFGYPYHGGGYGYPGYAYGGGYYGGDYYGGGYNRSVIYSNGARSGSGANPVLVGPRSGRGGAVMGNRAMGGSASSPGAVTIGNGRRDNMVAPSGGVAPAYNAAQPTGASQPQLYGRGAGRAATFGGGEVVGQPAASGSNAQPAGNGAATAGQANGRRGGFFREMFSNPGNASNANANGSNANINGGQSMQRRSYSQPSYEQRSM